MLIAGTLPRSARGAAGFGLAINIETLVAAAEKREVTMQVMLETLCLIGIHGLLDFFHWLAAILTQRMIWE